MTYFLRYHILSMSNNPTPAPKLLISRSEDWQLLFDFADVVDGLLFSLFWH